MSKNFAQNNNTSKPLIHQNHYVLGLMGSLEFPIIGVPKTTVRQTVKQFN
jgi:hypothetical protein